MNVSLSYGYSSTSTSYWYSALSRTPHPAPFKPAICQISVEGSHPHIALHVRKTHVTCSRA